MESGVSADAGLFFVSCVLCMLLCYGLHRESLRILFFYAQARREEYAAKAACGPRGEWGKQVLPCSIVLNMEESMTEQEKRIAVIGIVVEDVQQAGQVNGLLHQYGSYIIGRMGIPYKEKQLNIISIVVDAPMDIISALSGKLGRLPGVSTKALYSKV